MKRMWSKNELKNVIQEQASSGQLKEVKVFEEIVDKDAHKRFIEGEGDIVLEQEGVDFTYAKWSLSGSHLLLVIAGTVEDETVLTSSTTAIVNFYVPKWIYDKIYPVFANVYIEQKSFNMTDVAGWSTQTVSTALKKESNVLGIRLTSNVTLTAKRGFRIAYDLLIDNE